MDEHPPASGDRAGRPPGSPGALDTTTLLVRARGGDEAALEALCARLLPRLRHWATGRLPAQARGLIDTGDLVQESLLRTIKRLPALEPTRGSALYAYLRQAILNRIRDEARRVRRRTPPGELTGEEPDPSPSPLEEVVGRDAVQRFDAAMERLDELEREAIIGRVELGLGFAELAEAMGKPSADAARMAVNRALVRLAREMSIHGE